MNLLRSLGRGLSMARKDGLGRTTQLACHRAHSIWWDNRLGIETMGGRQDTAEYGDDPENLHYSASSYFDLFKALRVACPSPVGDVFIDFGSGKGRAVLGAATRPFRRVIGVELSESLTRIARQNLDHARPRLRCQSVELVSQNALTYELPDDVTVIYFCNPFGGHVMSTVLQHVRDSLDRVPRPLRFVVATPPRFELASAGMRWIEPVSEFQGMRRHVIYRATA